jgi:superfamily II DNA/RNA helicase
MYRQLHGILHHYVLFKNNTNNDESIELEKMKKVENIFDNFDLNQVVLYAHKPETVQALNQFLLDRMFPSTCTFQNQNPHEKSEKLREFQNFQYRYLVTDENVSEMISFEGVSIVILFDMVSSVEEYRAYAGRAGHLGIRGLVVSFLEKEEDVNLLKNIEDQGFCTVSELPESIDARRYSKSFFHFPVCTY